MTDDGTQTPTTAEQPDGSASGNSVGYAWYIAGVVALAVLVVSVLVLVGRGDDADTVAGPGVTPQPTTTPSPEPEPDPEPVDRSTAVWPVSDAVRYTDPVAAARAFAAEFLGFTDPVVGSFAQGDSRSGEVEVRPVADGPATTVLLRQLTGEDSWSVLGATTDNIEVTQPSAAAAIRSPVTVAGSAHTFEGNVVVEVRQDGRGAPLGTGFVTGGGDEMRPFRGTVPFDQPTAGSGALVFLTQSAEDGSVWEAAVLRVRLDARGTSPVACEVPGAPGPGADETAITVFFTCDPQDTAEGPLVAVPRVVPRTPAVLQEALTALLEGPTAQEREAGLTSWFSPATADALRDVTLSRGHAVVDLADLREVIPGASSSAGSQLLLSQLDATVLQFPTVSSVEYRIEGDCSTFTEWVQLGGCEPRS